MALTKIPSEQLPTANARCTASTHKRRFFNAPISTSTFQVPDLGDLGNWSLKNDGNLPQDDVANGVIFLPFGSGGANQIILDFFGTGSGSFAARFSGVQFDASANSWGRRIRLFATCTLGAKTCPQDIAGVASALWVDAMSVTAYTLTPTTHVLSAPGGGVAAELLFDPLGDHLLMVELAKNGGTAGTFNGRYRNT